MTFLAFWDFSKTFQSSNNYLETKMHQMKWFLGQNSYQMKIQEIDHSDEGGQQDKTSRQNLIKTYLFLVILKMQLLFKSVLYWRGYCKLLFTLRTKVIGISVLIQPFLCRKWPILDSYGRVQKCHYALKWDTVWASTSTDTEITKGQI